ncbi:hypothetical protein TEA_018182 [Camellia sinensis var. sinensis]|uniref:Uncharacterized protein n=1 Tax=Camellia sinensis var. sinensis TaxID=542762 RepID=A0A4S4D204_CAMSN|nr:hypothetical protein TEA_018182 [Camellia sinensis var. sinensis]
MNLSIGRSNDANSNQTHNQRDELKQRSGRLPLCSKEERKKGVSPARDQFLSSHSCLLGLKSILSICYILQPCFRKISFASLVVSFQQEEHSCAPFCKSEVKRHGTMRVYPSFSKRAQYRNGQSIGGLLTYSTGNAGQPMKAVVPNVMVPSASKNRGPVKPQSKMGFYVADVDNLQKTSDIIKIRATNKLLHKVESMICGREVNPDPVQVEKAKAILLEHEVAILEVLAKLADVSDGDDSPKQFQYHEERQRIGRGMATQKDLMVTFGLKPSAEYLP